MTRQSVNVPTIKDADSAIGKKILRKSLKYADLIADCKDRGRCAWLFPVEVIFSAISMEAAGKTRNIRKSM